jgi:hypothetical protein
VTTAKGVAGSDTRHPSAVSKSENSGQEYRLYGNP